MNHNASPQVPLRRWLSVTGPEFGRVMDPERFWFPGRWLAGLSLILGPLFLLTGVLLRSPYHFFYPEQLAAYQRHPALITAAYACFGLGNILLWPGVVALCRGIGATRPVLATWAGALVILGLLTRAYHSGTDQIVFAMADTHDAAAAGQLVSDYYEYWRDLVWHPFRILAGSIIFGWIVLAIGAWRSRVLGPLGAVFLALMSIHAFGTMKGTEVPISIIATAGLTVAMLPAGVKLLRSGPLPSRRALIWTAVIATSTVLVAMFGPRG